MVQAAKSTFNPTDPRSMMEALQAPFSLDDLEWRVQRVVKVKGSYKAIVVPYVSNRAIQKRLDDLFTPFGWRNEFREWRQKGVLCGISILWDGQWITKFDGADETDIEGTKGGFSGSQKRAAVEWGIGRYLYSLDEAWVDVKSQGQNYVKSKVKVDGREEWITGYWDTPQLPDWALPVSTGPQGNSHHPKTQGNPNQGNSNVVPMPTQGAVPTSKCALVDAKVEYPEGGNPYWELIFKAGDKEARVYAVQEMYEKINQMDLSQGSMYEIRTRKHDRGIFLLEDIREAVS